MRPRPLAVTLGDPAGIGAELLLLAHGAVRAGRLAALPPHYILADPDWLAALARRLALAVPITVATPQEAADHAGALVVVPLEEAVRADPGKPDTANNPAVLASIARAVADVTAGHARAVVTNPIAKGVLARTGFAYPGHTEFLAALAATDGAPAPRPVMMIWSALLAVVPVTIHIPLARVPEHLTSDLIVETGRIVARDLASRFAIARPRLAVAGLNPHAGEGGLMGAEDDGVVAPAVARLRAEGIDARGPLPADTMFHERARQTYDVALGMYHDQVLIPVKALAFDEGVNVTLGLPFLRTSPDHGTAFDIAGRGLARFDSLVAALRLADRLTTP